MLESATEAVFGIEQLALGMPSFGEFAGDVVRFAKTLFAVGAVGLLATRVCVAGTSLSSAHRSRIAKWAGLSALAWALLALTESLTVAATVFSPQLALAQFWSFTVETRVGAALAWQAALAVATAALARLATPWPALASASCALVAAALGGHLVTHDHHGVATVSLAVHVIAATLWAGSLLGLLLLLRHTSEPAAAARRFGVLATTCAAAIGVSGAILVFSTVELARVASSAYGALLIAKTVAFAIILFVAHLIRTRAARIGRTTTLRFGVLELSVMIATFALATALSQAEPISPSPGTGHPLFLDPLTAPPTIATLVGSLAPSGVGLVVTAAVGVPYFWAVLRLHARGDVWPRTRSVAFGCGVLLLFYVTCGGIAGYASVLLSAHMVQHMMLNMVIPVLLVLGAPVTLAFRAASPRAHGVLMRAVRSSVARAVARPIVVCVIFIGSLYALYFTPLFPLLMTSEWGHAVMVVHFLLSGLLFFWLVLGIDPEPHRPSPPARIPLIVAAVLGHTVFAVVLVFGSTLIGAEWLDVAQPQWQVSRSQDQTLAGGIAWTVGEMSMVAVLIIVIVRWFDSAERADRARSRARRPSPPN